MNECQHQVFGGHVQILGFFQSQYLIRTPFIKFGSPRTGNVEVGGPPICELKGLQPTTLGRYLGSERLHKIQNIKTFKGSHSQFLR